VVVAPDVDEVVCCGEVVVELRRGLEVIVVEAAPRRVVVVGT